MFLIIIMKDIEVTSMKPGFTYYIDHKVYRVEKKIGRFIGYELTPNNTGLIAKFDNVKNINLELNISLPIIHLRHSMWYNFYLSQKDIIEKKIIEEIYRKAINKKLQIITGDTNFIWYQIKIDIIFLNTTTLIDLIN